MDIALKFKKVVATAAAGALMLANASVAIAQTFSDVPTDAWYYDYVEQLVDDGVVDAADNYRPGDALNRAELVKMVITSIDGLAGYEAPATPTFDDVPGDAWFYDYVEAAVQLGIVNGYTDASGNLTGMFGPGDTVNRAAATKILVNAYSVPTDTTPESIFPDVTMGAWYYDYVVTAYNQSILDGYANGYFGPADPVTRAQVAKLIVNAQDPVERVPGTEEEEEEGTTEEEEEETVSTSEGDLEVSLNDDTPASSTVPTSASSVDLLSFDLTAADDDVEVTNLVVTRGGVGNATDWDNLYLYDGSSRLTSGRSLNSDTNTATFPVNLAVEAGTTTTLTLVGDMASGAGANNQHWFYVASAADVTSNAMSVAGDFPVAGNTFTTGSVGVNSLTATVGSTPSSPQIGAVDAEIGTFRLQAGSTNDIALHQITLTQNGSFASSKMVNLRLLRGGTDELATADGFDGDRVTFVLDTPYVIPKGQTKSFSVNSDIDGGRTSDQIELYLDENTDLVAIDQQYGFGASVTNSTLTINGVTAINLKGGKVTVTDNGPTATQVASNSTNVKLLNYSLTTDRDLTVKNTRVLYTVQDSSGNQPDWSGTAATEAGTAVTDNSDGTYTIAVADDTGFTAGDMVSYAVTGGSTFYGRVTAVVAATSVTIACSSTVTNGAGTLTEVNVYTYIKSAKIVDLDSGATVAGPLTYVSSASEGASASTNTTYTNTYTEDYDLVGGDARHLSIQVDTDQYLPAGYQINAQVRYDPTPGTATEDNYIKDLAANEYVSDADIVGANLTGKNMTVANNSLTVTAASTPASNTYVKGDSAVPALGISFAAGDAGPITVKRFYLRAYGDNDGTFDDGGGTAVGDIAANTYVSSVTVYDGDDVVAGPVSLELVDANGTGYTAETDYYRADFTDLNLEIPAGTTKTYTAKLDLLNTMSSTVYVAVDIDPDDDVTAEDADDNTVTASGTSGLNLASTPSPLLTVGTSGTLNIYNEGNPLSGNVVTGTTELLVNKYRFNPLQEDFQINKLTIINDASGTFDTAVATSAVASVTVKYPDENGVTQTKTGTLSGGSVTLSNLGFYAPLGEDSWLEVYADINTKAAVGEGISGKSFRLGMLDTSTTLSTFEAVGVSSSTSDTDASLVTAIAGTLSTKTVRKTVPTLTKVAGASTLITGENTFYGVTVSADAAGSVGLARLVFEVTVSPVTTGAGLDLASAVPDIDAWKLQGYTTGASGHLSIYCTDSSGANATYIGGTSTGIEDCDGTADDGIDAGTYYVIVLFSTEKTVGAGSSATYYLQGTMAGAADNDSVSTRVAYGDDSTAVSGITGTVGTQYNGNANTGRVYSSTANYALFDDGTGSGCGTSVAGTNNDAGVELCSNRNIIWSDKSADSHSYPTVTYSALPYTLTTDTGSYDWTNGYKLSANNLTTTILTY